MKSHWEYPSEAHRSTQTHHVQSDETKTDQEAPFPDGRFLHYKDHTSQH